ncbi:hypothetical protein [Flindersiella endophytica]
MNVIERLRAADPAPNTELVTELEVAAALTAARNTRLKGRKAPVRPVSRRLLLGGIAASAVAAAVGPSLVTRQESASAATLRALARQVAAAPPPEADVLYAQQRYVSIETAYLAEPPLDPAQWQIRQSVRYRSFRTVESWHPLPPKPYKPYGMERSTFEYLTPGDADRATRLTPQRRRQLYLPPEGIDPDDSTPSPICARAECGWTYPNDTLDDDPATFSNATAPFVRDLPSDPAALKALIDDTPELDRFHNYNWSPSDTYNRLVNWDDMRDERYGAILLGLLKFVPTPQPVRAAVIDLLAEVQSIVVYGSRTIGSRTGLAIGHQGHPAAEASVIDRETGLIIHERTLLSKQEKTESGSLADLPVGTEVSESTLLHIAYVPVIGDRP